MSPSRLKAVNIDSLEIEDDMSLGALEKIKSQLMDKMGLDTDLKPVHKEEKPPTFLKDGNDKPLEMKAVKDGSSDVEDGEVPDSDSEEVKTPVKVLRNKIEKVKPPSPRIENPSPIKILDKYSADDIEKKLREKQRQFHELKFEEKKLKSKIEEARSKSNTPRRLSESSECLKSSPPLMIASSPPRSHDGDADDESDPRKVSPLKLNIRGVVIAEPSSSSSSLDPPDRDNKPSTAPPTTTKTHNIHLESHDDNAMSPIKKEDKTPPKDKNLETVSKANVLDVSRDLILTDDSDLEQSPVKQPKVPQLKTPVGKKDSLSFGVIRKLPLTPKENLNSKKVDMTSPQGISSLLKSPMVGNSMLATSSPLSSKPTNSNSPEMLDENSSSSNSSTSFKKKKRKVQLSRSKTSVQ